MKCQSHFSTDTNKHKTSSVSEPHPHSGPPRPILIGPTWSQPVHFRRLRRKMSDEGDPWSEISNSRLFSPEVTQVWSCRQRGTTSKLSVWQPANRTRFVAPQAWTPPDPGRLDAHAYRQQGLHASFDRLLRSWYHSRRSPSGDSSRMSKCRSWGKRGRGEAKPARTRQEDDNRQE